MQTLSADTNAQGVVEKTVHDLFGDTVEKVILGPAEDFKDDPALSVTIYMKPLQEDVSGSKLLQTISATEAALREIGDLRFPYVTFLSPEDEPGEGE